MMRWSKEFEQEVAARLDEDILNNPEYLLTQPAYGAVISPGKASVCVHRLIGADQQYERDWFHSRFLPEYRVPIWRRASATQMMDQSTVFERPREGVYRPLNIVSSLTVAAEAVSPPAWLRELDKFNNYTVWLVRYVRVI